MAQTGKELTIVQQKAVSLRKYLNQTNIKDQFEAAIPKWLSVDRLLKVVFTSVMKNPKLIECTQESILSAVMQCCQLGLEPILGRAHLIPYLNSKYIDGHWIKVYECNFQPGYQGLIDLGQRSGKIDNVHAHVVYEKDHFEYEEGFDRILIHRPHPGEDAGKPIGAYAVWELSSGTRTFDFMWIHDIYKRRDVSQAYQNAMENIAAKKKLKTSQETPWLKWEADMIKKTVIINSCKTKPASIEFMQAVELDGTAELGKSQLGMFLDTEKLPELEAPISETEPEPEAETEDETPPDTTLFLALVKKQIGKKYEYVEKDGKPVDLLSKFVKASATAQKPSVTSEDLMSMVTEKSFPSFWNSYLRFVEAQEDREKDSATSTKKQESGAEDEPTNFFDKSNWKSSKLGAEKVSTVYHQNKDAFAFAKQESKQEFRSLWYRRYKEKQEDGSYVHPFPPDMPKEEPPAENDQSGTGEPEQLTLDDQSGSSETLEDRTGALKHILDSNEELYLKACEEEGYNSMVVPELLEEQDRLWKTILGLQEDEKKF